MISIFAKPAFLNINPHQPFKERKKPPRGHLQRVSSIIRGEQIAEQIGAKLNPKRNYQNDVCIYVKPHIKKGDMNFNFEGRKAYLDIIDGHNLAAALMKYPKVGLIVCSEADYETMSKFLKNPIVIIPQHHCNFERIKRTRKRVTTVGTIGTLPAFNFLPKGLEEGLTDRGMRLIKFSKFFRRQDIIDFYKKIDLQIVWRPYKKILSNPLKIVNASSFGIPTIALDEPAFKEMDNSYLPVSNLEEFFAAVDFLRDSHSAYKDISEKALRKSEDYHIERIGELYKRLDK